MGTSSRLLSLAMATVISLGGNAWGFNTTLGGRRVDLDGSFEVRGAVRVDGATAPDDPQEVLRLRLALELTEWLSFETSAVGMHGGPTSKATKAGGFNYNDAFQDVNPSFEFDEAFFDVEQEEFSVRVGMQKIFWGKLDRQQPNDLTNPYRFIDPFLVDQHERKIPVPAILGTYAPTGVEWLPEEAQFTAVWMPMYVPFRLPVLGERWFPPAAETPPTFDIPGGVIRLPDGSFLPALSIPISETEQNISPPARNLANSGLGLRASGYAKGVDFAGYYYHGYDVQPTLRLLVDAVAAPNPNSPLGFDVSADTFLQPVYSNIDSIGADAAYTAGPFTVRGEGAFVVGRTFSRNLSDLVANPAQLAPQIVDAFEQFRQGATRVPIDVGPTFVEKNSFEWGVGADYTYEGWFALLQMNQTDVFDNPVQLLIHNVETRFLANLRKSFFSDRLRAQFVGLYGLSGYFIALPRLTYFFTDYLDLQIGYLAISGSRNTIGGQYKNNDEGYIRARVTF
jgi:hypothetical protein